MEEEYSAVELDNGKYRIRRLDKFSIVLEVRPEQKKADRKSKNEWRVWRYYPRLEYLVDGLINLMVTEVPQAPCISEQLILLNQKLDTLRNELIAELRERKIQ